MTSTLPLASDQASPLRALHSLREPAIENVETILAALGLDWTAQRVETPDGHLMLLLWTDEEASGGFVLHGHSHGVRLGTMIEDAYAPVGWFETLCAAVEYACGSLGQALPLAPAAA